MKTYNIRLKKDDTVMVRTGKYKGQTGKVILVHPRLNKVTVEGVNVVKKHLKPTREHPQDSIVEITQPIWVSKVGVLDSAQKKPSRLRYKLDKTAKKSRLLSSSGKELK